MLNQEQAWRVRQTQLEINLTQLKHNFFQMKKVSGKADIICVIKCDAYGHQHEQVVTTLDKLSKDAGLHGFGVANVEEGLALRRVHVLRPIYVLSGIQTFNEELLRCLQVCKLTPVISSMRVLLLMDKVVREQKTSQVFHLKFNTGMNRLGLDLHEIDDAILILKKNPYLKLEGVLSHYAASEKKNHVLTKSQNTSFRALLKKLEQEKIHPKYIHIENSAGVLNKCFPEANLARVGFSLYDGTARWTAQVYQVRTLCKGDAIGYGAIFRAPKKMKIAILGVGYGDGYPRALSNKSDVLINGRRCRVVGAVSMDLIAVDITKVPDVSELSSAVLMGTDGNQTITAHELAKLAKTIPYEIYTGISPRVPRVFIE